MSARPVREDGTFHILQITDFHNDTSVAEARRSWADVQALIDRFEPDFLAVTGDIWCSDEEREHGPARMERDLEWLASFHVPWAFTWGNHDWLDDRARRQKQIARTPGACMNEGDGLGNCRVTITRGTEPAWDLYFLDSGLEWNPERDLAWFEDDSRQLAASRGRVLPAIAYFHIPLKQYEEARLSNAFTGIAQEEVLCWGDDGSILDRFKRAGNVRFCFCGHSHVNDFYFESEGIILGYGRATGYGGYGEDRLEKGAKRLILDTNTDSVMFETVFPDGRTALRYPKGSV